MEYIDFTGNRAKVYVDDEGLLHMDLLMARPVPVGADLDQLLATIGYIPVLAKPAAHLRVIK